MQYRNMVPGRFIDRPNRFVAHVDMGGTVETVHVKNTGRCLELLQPGAEVFCQRADNPARSTKFDLICVQKGPYLINMDAQAPNAAAKEWLERGGLGPAELVRPEQKFGHSRFDFYLERDGQGMYLEVKGVTLEEGGICRFPDAPTERGTRHLRELVLARRAGYGAAVLFVIQMRPVKWLEPNDRTDPAFGQALREAAEAGVEILAVDCRVTEYSMDIGEFVPVKLTERAGSEGPDGA